MLRVTPERHRAHQRGPERQRARVGPHTERVLVRARAGGWRRGAQRDHRRGWLTRRRREFERDVLRVVRFSLFSYGMGN